MRPALRATTVSIVRACVRGCICMFIARCVWMHVCNMKCVLRATTVSIVRACVHVYVHGEVRVDACVQHEVCVPSVTTVSIVRACMCACVCSSRGACGCMCAT